MDLLRSSFSLAMIVTNCERLSTLRNFSKHNFHTCAYYPNNMGTEYLTLRILPDEHINEKDTIILQGPKHYTEAIKKEVESLRKREKASWPQVWMYLEAISNSFFELHTTIEDRMVFKRK